MMIYFRIILKEKYSQKKKSEGEIRNKIGKFLKLYDRYIHISVLSTSLFLCVSKHFHNKSLKRRGEWEGKKDNSTSFICFMGKMIHFPQFPFAISLYSSLTKTTGSLCLKKGGHL